MRSESRIILPNSPEIIMPDPPEIIIAGAPGPAPAAVGQPPLQCKSPRGVSTDGPPGPPLKDPKTDQLGRVYRLYVDASPTKHEETRIIVFVPVLKSTGAMVLGKAQVVPVSDDDRYDVFIDDEWRGLKVVLVATDETIDFRNHNFDVKLKAIDAGPPDTAGEHGNTPWQTLALQAAASCLEDAVEWLK